MLTFRDFGNYSSSYKGPVASGCYFFCWKAKSWRAFLTLINYQRLLIEMLNIALLNEDLVFLYSLVCEKKQV
jgi:hypothetical protein